MEQELRELLSGEISREFGLISKTETGSIEHHR